MDPIPSPTSSPTPKRKQGGKNSRRRQQSRRLSSPSPLLCSGEHSMEDYLRNAAIDKQVSGNGHGVGDPPSTSASDASAGKKGGKSTPAKLVRREYSLRSSMDGIRVLRPRNSSAATPEPVMGSSEKKGRRGRKKSVEKKKACGEFESIRSQCKYLLNRINYEQNLLDAYAAEGWRGQSLEKIRPEKELQRATSEITRCKIKLRDFFKKMDTLCAEGKLDESFFDSQGEIDSEDIFCSKCGLKDVSADNDIILCDGACDCGFHQMCLEPPLLKDQIPANDESWLCPGCDCKIDCIESINHILGTKYSIEDKWEKIFPEAATAAAGYKHGNNALDLPLDDSEDDDYNPDDQVVEPSSGNGESLNSDESSESFISDNIVPKDSSPSNCDKPFNPADLPSDDSDDDDYDPLRHSPEEKVKTEGSTSDESDFSSDTDDLGGFVEDNGSLDPDETHATSALSRPESFDTSYNKHYAYDHRPAIEDASNLHSTSTIVRKRNQDHLPHNNNEYDFKNSFSGLSGAPLEIPKKRTRAYSSSPKLSQSDSGQKMVEEQTSQAEVSEGTPGGLPNKLESGCAAESCEDVSELDASEVKVTSSGSKTFSTKVTKTLNDQFKQGMYPTKEKKESLSKELGLSVYQVSRWFENARRKSRHSSMTLENETGNSPLRENSAKADANIVSSQLISEKTELVVDGDGTFNSESQEAKNKRNSEKPSVDRTAGLATADATVTKDMEIDAPKVVLTVDNGRKSISFLPPGTRFKTKSKRSSQLQSN